MASIINSSRSVSIGVNLSKSKIGTKIMKKWSKIIFKIVAKEKRKDGCKKFSTKNS